jgi:adenosylhomocysteine nucleosidase
MKPTLVCFALKEEAGVFRRRAAELPGVEILITGIGRNNATRSVREFLARAEPARVFTCGFAGGLNPDLAIGDVVSFTNNDALAPGLLAAGAKPGSIACVDTIAITVAEKAALRHATGADAVEMESGHIQNICHERGIACATVRAISDSAHDDLPLDFNQLYKPDQSLDFGKLAFALARNPGKIPALLRLQKNCARASHRLADVLTVVVSPRSAGGLPACSG